MSRICHFTRKIPVQIFPHLKFNFLLVIICIVEPCYVKFCYLELKSFSLGYSFLVTQCLEPLIRVQDSGFQLYVALLHCDVGETMFVKVNPGVINTEFLHTIQINTFLINGYEAIKLRAFSWCTMNCGEHPAENKDSFLYFLIRLCMVKLLINPFFVFHL